MRRRRDYCMPLAVGLAVVVFGIPELPGCCSINEIRTKSLPDATVGQPYSFTLEQNCCGKSSLYTAMSRSLLRKAL